MSDEVPEPDRLDGAPHPRETRQLFGQDAAEAAFLSAHASGRLPHAWLITGPRGIGKATFAWRAARFLLATPEADGGLFGAPPPPATLAVDPDLAVARHVRALTHPGLFLLRRSWDTERKKMRAQIVVDDMRQMKGFFGLSAADGGRRIVIIDDADEMNPNAANALLKLLEEPPPGAVLFLISHQPFRLLPTIRSRCRVLRLQTLGPDDLDRALAGAGGQTGTANATSMAELAGGSVGAALQLTAQGGLDLYADIVGLMGTLPRMSRPRAIALCEVAAGRASEVRFDLTVTLIDLFLARLARTGTTGAPPPEATPGEAAILQRLAPHQGVARAWADCAQTLGNRARRGKAVNLDPAALLMDMVLKIDETAGTLAPR
ncbi:MAG: DNA polymerase III subunit delta' [Pseudomonadota bacterium]